MIPRIAFHPKDRTLPFEMERKQFPVRLCFSVTSNKSQGQSIKHVGVFLGTQEFFSHGQLYVALSRSTDPNNLKVYHSPEDKTAAGVATMMNVVFKEILVCKCAKCSDPKQSSRYWYPLIDSGLLSVISYLHIAIKSNTNFKGWILYLVMRFLNKTTWWMSQTRVSHWVHNL